MKKAMTSERIRKEFAMQAAHLPGGNTYKQAIAEKPATAKISFVKRMTACAALVVGIGAATVFTVDAVTPQYDGTVDALICWDCTQEGSYKTPAAAIKAVNPDATDKQVALAEKEFVTINELPQGLDYKLYLQAGEYQIPVIK